MVIGRGAITAFSLLFITRGRGGRVSNGGSRLVSDPSIAVFVCKRSSTRETGILSIIIELVLTPDKNL